MGSSQNAVYLHPRQLIHICQDWFRLLSDPDTLELDRMMQIGQLVTWPKVRPTIPLMTAPLIPSGKLHMIENRTRIEKQIFIGRRAIRKVHRPSHGHARPTQENQLPQNPNMELPPRPTSPPVTDYPLSVDTEAEAAFARGSRWYFRRGRGTPTLPSDSQQPTTVDDNQAQMPGRRHGGAPKTLSRSVRPHNESNSSGSIFLRLRNTRFPFPSLEKTTESNASKISTAGIEQENAWSSESSSETIDERRLSQFSLIPTVSTQDLPTVDYDSDEEGDEG